MLELVEELVAGTATAGGQGAASYDEITATNKSGASVSKGDKVWLNGADIINFSDGQKNLNYLRKQGNPTISSDYISSNFSSSNYILGDTTPQIEGFDTKNCIGYIKFNSGSLVSSSGFIIEGKAGCFPALQLQNSNFNYWNGSATTTAFSVSANTNYWVKTEVTNGTTIKFYKSTDGQTYTLEHTGTVSSQAGNQVNIFSIGYASYSSYFRGTIDLKEVKVENANGDVVWTALREAASPNITAQTLTGFSLENIANNATGKVKTVLE